jgi:hypothetical protein
MDKTPGEERESNVSRETDPETARSRLQILESRASRGLWVLAVFAAISLWARSSFRYLPSLPPEWDKVMGRPPPVSWINAAFILYVFSALVLSLLRMAGGPTPASGFQHVGYLTAFYGFYYVAGALDDNFWAVLVGGFVILTLECYRNWTYYRHRIQEEIDRIDTERRK